MCAIHFGKGWHVAHWIRRTLSRRCGSRISVGLPTFPAESPVKRAILDLPTKLLLDIFSFMSLPSQACLAISSKRFHQLFGYVLEAEELRFPRMPQNGLTYVITEEYNMRMSLLIQLENKNWACCGRCQRLHPPREFSARQLMDYHPWDRTCMAWAGIVDLCPCISLTIRDRTRIVKYLKSPECSKPRLNFINNGLLSTGEQHLLHQCMAYPRVQIEMWLRLTESEELISYTRYEVPNFDCPWREMDGTMPLCCSQVWLDVFGHRARSPWNCPCCNACMVKPSCSCAGIVRVRVVRFLGRANCNFDPFEKQWYKQCRSLEDYIPT